MKWILLIFVFFSFNSFAFDVSGLVWSHKYVNVGLAGKECPSPSQQKEGQDSVSKLLAKYGKTIVFTPLVFSELNGFCYYNYDVAFVPSESCSADELPTNTGECLPEECSVSPDAEYVCPLPPSESCQHDAGKVVEGGLRGKPSQVKPWYCAKKCRSTPVKVGDICIGFGGEEETCSYELVSSGYNCDGTGSGSSNPDEDGDGKPDLPDPEKPVKPTDPVPDGNGDGSEGDSDGDGKPDGDGSLEPPAVGGDDTGGTGDGDGDGVITGSDIGSGISKIVENTARTVEAIVQNTNVLGSKIDAIGGGGGGGGGKPDFASYDCETNVFKCEGDPIQCTTAKMQFAELCLTRELSELENAIKPVSNIDNVAAIVQKDTVDFSKLDDKYLNGGGVSASGSCPKDKHVSFSIADSKVSLKIPFKPLCGAVELFSPIVILMGWVAGLTIIGRSQGAF